MYRLLIVDDEPYIVDFLMEMISEQSFEMELYRAYSAAEAMKQLEKTKMDIVLTDISMPGTNGLELQRKIRNKWPRCKVIFLTGYDEFNYVQEAIRNGGLDFILKTDGEEAIMAALEKAVHSLAADMEVEMFISKAKQQLQAALPVLQKEYVTGLVEGEHLLRSLRDQRFNELSLPLDSGEEVLLVVGRVDVWGENLTVSDKVLLLYAVQNIAEEFITARANMLPVIYRDSKFFWLVQPIEQNDGSWASLKLFTHETLDSIQETCKNLLKLPVSLVAGGEAISWNELPRTFDKLNKLLARGLGYGREMLLIDSDIPKNDRHSNEAGILKIRSKFKKLGLLEALLESGQQQNFQELFKEIMGEIPTDHYHLLPEVYYSMATLLLSYIHHWNLRKPVSEKVNLDRLTRLEDHSSWNQAANYLLNVSYAIFAIQDSEQEEKSNELVRKLHHYIDEHLDGDLSLTQLSEVVYLNRTYLCRVYKQLTGMGLSEYITGAKISKAKELLKNRQLKVHEIAKQIGFDSAPYFTRFFKKIMNMTPQEYREAIGE